MLCVIIPLAQGETQWRGLVSQLEALPANSEIILAYGENAPDISGFKKSFPIALRCVSGKPGRASQMNVAAGCARGSQLWFLHADCRLEINTIPVLLRCIEQHEPVLWYHDLGFLDDGPRAMRLNELGVRFRSNILKMPFGDQGFCLERGLFLKLEGYPEAAHYGEDHLLVWRALQAGIPVRSTGAKLFTSARKYARGGWFKTTLKHQVLWAKQALPEFLKLLKSRKS